MIGSSVLSRGATFLNALSAVGDRSVTTKSTVYIVGEYFVSAAKPAATSQVDYLASPMDQIRTQVNLIREMNLYIAQAAEEQHSVAEEVSRSVNRIAGLNSDNSARVSALSRASADLHGLSERLAEQLRHFQV